MNVLRMMIVAAVLLAGSVALAGEAAPAKPVKTDKCPVCGMKDMFKYYFNIKKYHAAKDLADIASISLTDYYTVAQIDGRKAWYVAGSDVCGPMGRELIPFATKADAEGFMKDHAGKKLLRFDEVTPDLIKGLD